jgi:hypothetical protein
MANNFTKRGIARFPRTDQPYTFDKAAKKSVPDPKGKFELQVIFTAEAAEPVLNVAKEAAKAAGLKAAQVKNWPWKDELDKETEEPTGRIVVTFKQFGMNKDGSKRRVGHFDGKLTPLPRSFRLTHGSEVIVNYRANAFKELGGGVSLYMDGVQITKYHDPNGNPGFVAQDDGFAYDRDDDDYADQSDNSGSDADTADSSVGSDETDF